MASQPDTTNISQHVLERAHSPDHAATILREKVKQRPLLLRPSAPDPTLNARSKRQYDRHQKAKASRKSNKPKPLNAKQKRALCIFDIPKSQRKYSIYEPLHTLWCSYIREILGITAGRAYIDGNSAGPLLVSADYHGALVEVVRSRCPSRVGLKGVVVRDTKFTFDVITEKDQIKTVPKEHTVFRLEVPFEEEGKKPVGFEVYGSHFETRAPDRANKKFRPHYDVDL
ncbi:Ribonuclease P protein subunit p29 [Fulvia fulva]|uniref:Ribonuclease P protein subunit n=1 Tax=Passalora fulva TaxID=5499 RepID=A0A9Q8LGS8_PASFU|nr:Ribonuclease P protein subunit p29 [Fulvia fulva]KAK4615366.1 Ribonuclease P protein subunit p29 [Fulvia fulva]KAK4616456.1 Ribonuclease P protein subunit p29 [Fulvia fulva]UJO17110.1 Ribonuclease P protein subunit p29 [Fulvia fulva]WPV19348.1 Ribonuclease P protein subunit p29 [Fulvia fulva]WPV34641.1 Ribonuclease P protein subunit p29 [Fulvia fulva]